MSEEQIMQTQEDNAMDSSFLTPQSWFFSEPIRSFQVPVYQRLFAWKKPQFDRLLSDIKAHWEKLENKNKPYYLGIITVVKRDNQDNQYVLVDGQQRLTVLAILASMLETENRNPLASISNFLDYEARPADKKALQAIASSGNKWLIASETWTETDWKNVLDKENIASYSMREFVEHISKHKEDWTNCWANLKKGLKLFISELPEAYKTDLSLQNEYFEKMNSAGKQLEPHEILKVRICSEETFDKWNAIEDFTRKYTSDSKSDNYEPICLIQAIGQAPKTTPNNSAKKTSVEKWRPALFDFPMFLLHVLKQTLETLGEKYSLPADSYKLLEDFETWKEQIRNVDFVTAMERYRKFLDEWIIHKEVLADNTSPANTSSTENNFDADDSRFKYWQTNERDESVYLGNDDSQELKKRIKQIQMALFVLGGQQQEWICETYQKCHKSLKGDLLYADLVNRLIEKADFRNLHLTGEEWPDERLVYSEASHAQFVCLDFFLWLLANSEDTCDQKQKNLKDEIFRKGIDSSIRTFVPRGGKSVEHFHPQTDTMSHGQDEWSAPCGNGKTLKDMFGNLALISAGQNSKFGNMPVGGKSDRIREQLQTSNLESIKLYLMMCECGGQDEIWTPKLAQDHANKMLKVIQWGLEKFPDNKDQNNEGSQSNAN